MGAHESSPRQGAGAVKTCYYELLGIERHATDNDIKKAYRLRALELHPDRNIKDVKTATRRFAEVQAAYDVLSDAQERAWYDSHRDAILSGQDHPGDGAEPASFHDVRLTTTREVLSLVRKFDAAVLFNDEPAGFFAMARDLFEHLALEEEAVADSDDTDCREYPAFGSSDGDYNNVVKPFYAAWSAFSTKKTFSWRDKHRLSDAPDRRVRRLMEKENKKSRDDAIREFNDAVRFLVGFIRKRDPRYRPKNQTDAERQKSLRDAAAAQAARSRAAHQEKMASYHAPDWAGSRDDDADEHLSSLSEEESEVVVLECVVCNKSFKSAKQLEAHERSKKHVKALQHLRRQMERQGAELELDLAASPTPGSDQGVAAALSAVNGAEEERIDVGRPNTAITGDQGTKNPQGSAPASDSDEYAPRSVVEGRLTPNTGVDGQATGSASNGVGHGEMTAVDYTGTRPCKVGKAKAKRERKAAALRSAEGNTNHQCSVCAELFASRTRLFRHIREEGHAAAAPGPVAADGKATKKKQ